MTVVFKEWLDKARKIKLILRDGEEYVACVGHRSIRYEHFKDIGVDKYWNECKNGTKFGKRKRPSIKMLNKRLENDD